MDVIGFSRTSRAALASFRRPRIAASAELGPLCRILARQDGENKVRRAPPFDVVGCKRSSNSSMPSADSPATWDRHRYGRNQLPNSGLSLGLVPWRHVRCLDLACHRSSCPTGPIRPLISLSTASARVAAFIAKPSSNGWTSKPSSPIS